MEGLKESNEKVLFILNRSTGMAMYSHEFITGGVDPQLLSGFFGAMAGFLQEFIGSEESQWKTVYGSDTTLMVEGRSWAAGVLAVSRETSELRSKLRMIVTEFEASYLSFKDARGIEGGLLVDYDEFVMRIFLTDRLTQESKLSLKTKMEDFSGFQEPSQITSLILKLLKEIGNGVQVSEVGQILGISDADAIEIVYRAYWLNAINIDFIPSLNDTLISSERALSFLFSEDSHLNLSADTIRLIGLLDGRLSLQEIMQRIRFEARMDIMVELGDLIRLGYIQPTIPEFKLVLTNEQILNRFLQECSSFISTKEIFGILLQIIYGGVSTHPWLSRVRLMDNNQVRCLLNEMMLPSDLDELYDAIQFILNETQKSFYSMVDKKSIDEAMISSREVIHL